MRLGLFGGTFDPIHLGHLILAESCREACSLDCLWFIVTAHPPHKRAGRTPVTHRLEMARLAIAGHKSFEVSEIESRDDGPHYSYQTVEALRQERPGDELFFVIGGDSLADLPTWRHPERLAAAARIVVVNRPGVTVERTPSLGPGTFPLEHVTIPGIGISSTDLRIRVAEGRSIRYMVPRAVEAYIQHHGLYAAAAPGGSDAGADPRQAH